MDDEKRIYLIHGFNEKAKGSTTVGRLHMPLEVAGYSPKLVSYGYKELLGVSLCNGGLASMFAAVCRPGSTIIAFSNGCDITYRALEMGAAASKVVFINPALDRDKALAYQVKNIQVWHSPSDPWTGLARYIPFSDWGAQGKEGPSFEDERYEVVNADKFFGGETRHGGVFRNHRISRLSKELIKFIQD